MEFIESLEKYEEFKRLLLKTPLEPFTDNLFDVFQDVVLDRLEFKNILIEREEKLREKAVYRANLAKQLLSLLNNEPVIIGKTKVNNKKALEALKAAFIDEYKSLGMDMRDMTFEEAKEELENWRNDPNVENWIREELTEYYHSEKLPEEECEVTSSDMDWFIESDFNVELFAGLCEVGEEITPEQVERQTRLDLPQKKQGRKPKNYNLIWLILEIRKYYDKSRNEDYRLIFDCMDLFGLLDKVKVGWDKSYDTKQKLSNAKASYIKSIYKESLRYESAKQPILQASLRR